MSQSQRRILFVIKNLQQGGTERQVLRMLRCLDPERFVCSLCTLSPEIHYGDLPEGEPRYAFSATGRRAVAAIREAITDFQPHLVHSFRDGVNRLTWQALKSAPPELAWLMSTRGRPVLPADLLWARLMYRRAFRITTNSVGVEQTLRRFARIPKESIAVIPNFIDTEAFRPPTAAERSAARASLGAESDAFVWVLPARISWVKNQLGLLESLRRLKRDGRLAPRTLVILAGRHRDRIPVALVPRLIEQFGLGDVVRVTDAVSDPARLYAAADALVLPSIAEGMPNVVLEAQLSAVPVVVSGQANRDGLITDSEDGFVVPTGRPGALAAAMARLMSLPAPERQRMGGNGRIRVTRRFAVSAIADRLAGLYEAATSHLPAAPAFPGLRPRVAGESGLG